MTPLVLVHGFMGGSAQWADQVDALGDGRDVIAVDLPGFGLNAHLPAPDTIAGFARAVLDQIDARRITRFDLLGHSMGGMIVQEMVALAPERIKKLVLYGTGATGVLPGRFETIETSQARALQDGAEATARRISATWFLHHEAAQGYAACAELAALSPQRSLQAGLRAMQQWSGQGHLAHIPHQTLVIWGDHDRTYAWAQAQELWQCIERARLAVVPDCAHAVHLENPSVFNLLLSQFLASPSGPQAHATRA
ncbi:MAG: alpha/beta fold hydrolase [Roseovarius sp.]